MDDIDDRALRNGFPAELYSRAHGLLARSVREYAEVLSDRFYATFMEDPKTTPFLQHEVVHQRLRAAMVLWLIQLFDREAGEDGGAVAARQRLIGEAHGRIRIPLDAVLAGGRHLKTAFGTLVARDHAGREELPLALILIGERVDWAMGLMSQAQAGWMARDVKADEAFRRFSLGNDMGVERESQRASLMEWSHSILFSLIGGDRLFAMQPIARSPFGLWLKHRAALLFQGASGFEAIERLMAMIDADLLPALAKAAGGGANPRELAARLEDGVNEIKFHLNTLFQDVSRLEAGVDPLTRALNRRFLQTILAREIEIARRDGNILSILMIDVDHFKAINDTHGHSCGDMVLRELANIVTETVRSSDYFFRYGGEEFLVALVEDDASSALAIAERIRARFRDRSIRISDETSVAATVSIGVAIFDGHPDYQYLLRSADEALYEAKAGGRDRVVASAHPVTEQAVTG